MTPKRWLAVLAIALGLGGLFTPSAHAAEIMTFSSIADSYIDAGTTTTNYGSVNSINVGVSSGNPRHGLFSFDLVTFGLPAGAALKTGDLKIYANGLGGGTLVGAYQVTSTSSWTETVVTWIKRASGKNWTTPGGDYSGTVLSSIPNNVTDQGTNLVGWMHWNILTAVNAWYANSATNNGVLLRHVNEGLNDNLVLRTKEFTGFVPTLTVTFLRPVTGLTATAGAGQVSLSWTNPAAGSPSYQGTLIVRKAGSAPTWTPTDGNGTGVYSVGYSPDGGATVVIFHDAALGTSFTDTGLTPGTTYYYEAFARDSGNLYSLVSATVNATPTSTCAAVTGVSWIAAQAQSTQATVYWSSGAGSVMVIEKPTNAFVAGDYPTNGLTWGLNTAIGPNGAFVRYLGSATTLNRSGLTNNSTYYYQVFAYTGSGAATCYSSAAASAATARPSSTTQEAWSYMLAGGSALNPPIAGNDGIFFSSNAGRMISLNSATGLQNWTPAVTTSAVQGWLVPIPLSAGGSRVFAGDQGGTLYAVDTTTGAIQWQPALTGATAIQAGPSVQVRAWSNNAFATAYPPSTSTISYVTEAHAAGGAVGSLTYALTVPAGTDRALIVSVQLGSDCAGTAVPTVSGVTYATVALTRITSILGTPCAPGTTRSEQWQLVAPATGTNNVVVTLSGATQSSIHSGALLFTGVHQTTPVRAFNSASGGPASGNGASSTVNVTSAAGDMVVNTVGQGCGITSAGQTQRFLNNVNCGTTLNNSGGSTAPGAASVTMTWTFTSADEWQTISSALQPSSSAYDLIYVATKNGAGTTNNKVFALRSDTGAVVWTFNDGSGGNNWSVGEINGMPALDYGRNRLYVTSMSTSGTGASLWIVDITTGRLVGSPGACPTANTACVNLGDIDTAANISFDGNTLWVGNKTTSVYAINLAQAPGVNMMKWTAPLNLGANNQIKGLVWEDYGTSGRLYMVVANTTATSNAVRCFLDPGIGGTPNAANPKAAHRGGSPPR